MPVARDPATTPRVSVAVAMLRGRRAPGRGVEPKEREVVGGGGWGWGGFGWVGGCAPEGPLVLPGDETGEDRGAGAAAAEEGGGDEGVAERGRGADVLGESPEDHAALEA